MKGKERDEARETVDKRRRRQGNEPTYDALDKLSELQTRRGIIQAESVRRIPCRLREQATEFMLLDFGPQIRSCDRLEVGRASTFVRRLNTPQLEIILNWRFPKAYFSQATRTAKNTPIQTLDLLPIGINFELGSHFSTT